MWPSTTSNTSHAGKERLTKSFENLRTEKIWKLRNCREVTLRGLNCDCTTTVQSHQGVQNPGRIPAHQVADTHTPACGWHFRIISSTFLKPQILGSVCPQSSQQERHGSEVFRIDALHTAGLSPLV